jgi:hypothetical protein
LTEAATKPGPCQVGINAEDPCPRRAEVEILGVAFCGPCAREQQAYFVIGQLTQEKTHGFRSKLLAEALERMRRERAGSREGIAAEVHHGLSVVHESKPLALTNS